MILLEGQNIAKKIKETLQQEIVNLKWITPHLVAIQVGENEASQIYIEQQRKNCQKIGIKYECQVFSTIKEKDLIEFIQKLNNTPEITGIIVQLPLPSHFDLTKIRSVIDKKKDVEGVTPYNIGLTVYGKPRLLPCTAMSVLELIKSTKVNIYGKEVTIIGHSEIVGKPVGLLLLNEFATITICHIGTKDIAYHIKNAEILVVAVGKPNLIKGDWIKEGAIVIDVGINRIAGKIIGDVEFEKAKEKASFITPVPGGVGPLTVTMLLKNTIEAVKWQNEE